MHDPYFSPFAPAGRDNAADARQTLTDGRSVQALQAACAPAGSGAEATDRAELDAAGGRKALEELCAAWRGPPPVSHGAISNAHRRWVEDNRRRLPSLSATAASAAGD